MLKLPKITLLIRLVILIILVDLRVSWALPNFKNVGNENSAPAVLKADKVDANRRKNSIIANR